MPSRNSATPSPAGLPLEILEACIDASEANSWLPLARVSKTFHSLTTRSLYRNISLRSPASVITCSRTLLSNPTAAASVRTLSIGYLPNEPANQNYLSSYYAILRGALKSLIELQSLKLLVPDPALIFVLSHSTLPRLRHFECRLILTPPLVSFLNRHPAVNYLEVSPHEDITSSVKPVLPPLYLPELEYFAGNAEDFSAMSPTISLRAAFISWGMADTPPEAAVSVLERYSGESLNLLTCRRRGWNLDLIHLISTRLPYIYSLHIANILLVDSYTTDAYLGAVQTYLKRFRNLQRLVIHCVDVYGIANLACRMDVDFLTATSWGEACPSLMEISLPHSGGLSWHRITENVWVPDLGNVNGSTWLYTAILSNKYPGWHKLVNKVEAHLRRNASNPLDCNKIIAIFRLMAKYRVIDPVEEVQVGRIPEHDDAEEEA